MQRIRLHPSASVAVHDTGVQCTTPCGRFELSGADASLVVDSLLPLLDGSRSEEQLATVLPGIDPDSVRGFLSLLRTKGVVESIDASTPGATPSSPAMANFWQQVGPVPEDGSRALATSQVVMVGMEPIAVATAMHLAAAGVGRIRAYCDGFIEGDEAHALGALAAVQVGASREAVLRHLLASTGSATQVDVEPMPEGLRLSGGQHQFDDETDLMLCGLGHEQGLQRYQAESAAHASDTPSLSLHVEGREAWVGPLHIPGETACWNCLRMRRLAHRDDVVPAHSEEAQRISGHAPRAPRLLPAPQVLAAGMYAAADVVRVLVGAQTASELHGRVRIYDLFASAASLHAVVPMPWCPACGGAHAMQGDEVEPKERAVEPVADLPSLYQRLEGWLDPRFGVIRSFEAHPVGQPMPRTATVKVANYTEGDPSRVDFNLFGGGKGSSDLQAQLGAMGEAVERYSASRYRPEDLRRARLSDLEGDAIDPRQLALYECDVYSAADAPYARFDPEMELDWVQGTWFGTDEPVWVPALAAFFSYQAPAAEQLFQVSSSGLAAGTSQVDAALRATFELIERDATMLTWLCQLPAREVRLDERFTDGTEEIIATIERRGQRIELFLIDLDLGIPTIFCLGHGDGVSTPAVAASLSCHGDLRTAVRKALLELAHVTPYLSSIPRERVPHAPEGVRTLEEHAFFYIPNGREGAFAFLREGDPEPLSLASAPRGVFPLDPIEGTKRVKDCLERAELRVATVDLTSPDVRSTPYRVARAVGVNMQPIHFGRHLRRLANPRLQGLVGPKGLHSAPHPIA